MNKSEKEFKDNTLYKILSKAEIIFLQGWISGYTFDYNPAYARTLKHRIRHKYQSAKKFVHIFELNDLQKSNRGGLSLSKITLNKEELTLARSKAKARLPRRVSRGLRKTGMENVPRMALYPQYFSEEVKKLKKEKISKFVKD